MYKAGPNGSGKFAEFLKFLKASPLPNGPKSLFDKESEENIFLVDDLSIKSFLRYSIHENGITVHMVKVTLNFDF